MLNFDSLDFKNVLLWIAFVVLGIVSCWATAESLRWLLPSIPYVFIWIITIIFFVVSAIGTKFIIEGWKVNVGKFVSGILMIVIFWICFSLPTNTHTFFYRSAIKKVLTQDLEDTSNDIRKFSDDSYVEDMLNVKWNLKIKKIESYIQQLVSEAKNPGEEGIGPKCETILKKIETELGYGININRVIPRTNTHRGWNEVIDNYRDQIATILSQQLMNDRQNFNKLIDARTKKELKIMDKNIIAMQKRVERMQNIDRNIVTTSAETVSQAQVLLKNCKNLIDIDNAGKNRFIAIHVSETDRMLSVIDVWKDFFAGNYSGLGFVFWLILSVLVDVAAFIIFKFATD